MVSPPRHWERVPGTNVPAYGTFGRAAEAVRPDYGGRRWRRELAIMVVPRLMPVIRCLGTGMAGAWRRIRVARLCCAAVGGG